MHGPPYIPTESERLLWEAVEELEILDNWREFVLAHADIAVLDWPLEGDSLYMSPTYKRLLGYDDRDLGDTFNDWLQLIHPDDRNGIERAVRDAIAGKQDNYNALHRMQHETGNIVWVLFRSRILRNPNGQAKRMLAAAIEITDLKRQFTECLSY